MDSDPVELDEHRGMAAQKSTEIRRRSHEVQADQAALRDRQEEFERQAFAHPSVTWAANLLLIGQDGSDGCILRSGRRTLLGSTLAVTNPARFTSPKTKTRPCYG
jgi:hypothetical protein